MISCANSREDFLVPECGGKAVLLQFESIIIDAARGIDSQHESDIDAIICSARGLSNQGRR